MLDRAIIVALGSNMPGEYASSRALLEAALKAFPKVGLTVRIRSPWWRSAAWPDPAGPPYVNAVAIVETSLDPAATLAALHELEQQFGRIRHDRNAPRTLDLDLIAYGRNIAAEPALPHPRAQERLFVMGPLAQIAPGWVHPALEKTAAELAESAIIGADAFPPLS